MRKSLRVLFAAASIAFASANAEAIPLLQLDMAGGTYDPVTESIVAPGGTFTVYAVLTPKTNTSPAALAALLSDTYYVSVALTPNVGPAPSSIGSFSFGPAGGTQTTVTATSGMTYGVPPLEVVASSQGFDAGDLSKHGVFPTYFSEFALQFSPTSTTVAYNTQTSPGGLTPSSSGTAYYFAFTGDSSLLQSGYNLHFDLYSTKLRDCYKKGINCGDVDVDDFAPFSHDAQTTTQVPEPASALFLLLGAGALGMTRRRR